MAKEEIAPEVKEIKKALENNKLIIGTKLTQKNLKLGNAKKIFLSANCSDEMKKEIESLAKIAKVTVNKIKYPNDELGIICRKPFPISVLGFK
jgi:large subunit ribosomal protein L30e